MWSWTKLSFTKHNNKKVLLLVGSLSLSIHLDGQLYYNILLLLVHVCLLVKKIYYYLKEKKQKIFNFNLQKRNSFNFNLRKIKISNSKQKQK